MKFSYQWLTEWVDTELTPPDLAELMTMSGLEVDSVDPVAAPLEGIVVARIEATERHPDADKLQVCRVNDGSGEPLQVVCGAPNARVGLVAPFAQVGARLGELKIRRAKLRGVESMGMLCSGKELGLGDDHSGLLELPSTLPLGANLEDALRLNDATIDVDLTPNRADCLGIKGLAFEVAALTGKTAQVPPIAAVEPALDDRHEVILEAPADCPRFAGRIIRGIDPTARSPWWLKERLRRCGLRSISLLVDVTNFVLLELGQPMHAYDATRLSGPIRVRRGTEDESLRLLDGSDVDVNDSFLLITDDSGPIGLGGIMGGESTAINDATTDVMLEAAWFNPATIMGRARDLGLHTDASHRFERGVDPTGQRAAIERATALILEIAGGQAGPLTEVVATDHLPTRPAVGLRAARVERLLGVAIDGAEIERILSALGMQVEPMDGGWQVTPPGARFDIAIEEDLIEEIARVHGYNNIPATDLSGSVRFTADPETSIGAAPFRDALLAQGYFEAINFSFVGESELAALAMTANTIPLANPLSSDISIMRPALLPGLLRAAAHNLHRQQPTVRLMETGTVFQRNADGERQENQHIAGVLSGTALAEQWAEPKRPISFYDVKGDVERMIALACPQGPVAFAAEAPPHMHPGRSATVKIGERVIGYCGQLHPSAARALDIDGELYCFELDLELLGAASLPQWHELSRFPSIRRDIAIEVDEATLFADIEKTIREAAGSHLIALVLFDVYRGQGVETGCKSFAMGLILQDTSRTLTDSEVDETMQCVLAELKNRHGAKLRG